MKTKLLLLALFSLVVVGCQKEIKEFSYQEVTEEFKQPCEQAGTLERVEYQCAAEDGEIVTKDAYVYVPYGYSQNKKYEIIYIMHGGAANNTIYLGTQEEPKEMKHMFDHMIASGEIPPVLLVMPTIYVEGKPRGINSVEHFQKELGEKLIPLVEGKYSTYAKSTSDKDLITSRDHRYFTGFSMGGATTWSVFCNNMRYFRTFMPCSGHNMSVPAPEGKEKSEPADWAKACEDAVSAQGYTPKDFFVFSMTGTGDIAAPNLGPMAEAMKELSETFNFGLDLKKNNFYFHMIDGGEHNAVYFANYLHSMLPYILQ